jgi:hypothetical protein
MLFRGLVLVHKSNRGWKGRLQIIFSNLSIFGIEQCFISLFGSLGHFGSIFMDVSHTLEIAIYIVNQLKNDSYC